MIVREGKYKGSIYRGEKNSPDTMPGDKTKNKNYEQTLTLSARALKKCSLAS